MPATNLNSERRKRRLKPTGEPKSPPSSQSSASYPNGVPQSPEEWKQLRRIVETSGLPVGQKSDMLAQMSEDQQRQENQAPSHNSDPPSDQTAPSDSLPSFWEPRVERLRAEDYPNYVIETTNRMLQILANEQADLAEMTASIQAQNPELGGMEPPSLRQMRLMYEMAETVCQILNLGAQPPPPDLLVPDKGLVDQHGRKIADA